MRTLRRAQGEQNQQARLPIRMSL